MDNIFGESKYRMNEGYRVAHPAEGCDNPECPQKDVPLTRPTANGSNSGMVTADVAVTHWVRCSRVPPGWRECCDSCHEDENQGWVTLYIENADAGQGITLGVRYCCRGRERVQRRVDRLVEHFGGEG